MKISSFVQPSLLRYHRDARPHRKRSAKSFMARRTCREAYPEISFRPRSANWLSHLLRMPAECVHLDGKPLWMATFLPDILYLPGKHRRLRDPARPEVSLCRDCLLPLLEKELVEYSGRVVAFEPGAHDVTQYFFVAAPDFDEAGVEPTLAGAIGNRLARDGAECRECSLPATWQWLPRGQVANLDAVDSVASAPGEHLCAAHGSQRLCQALASIAELNLYYLNVPYGEGGAYLWF